MVEKTELAYVGDSPARRTYSEVVTDEKIRSSLHCLLILEDQLSQTCLTTREREGVVVAHTFIWQGLPDKYKSELADLTAVSS